ncbi:MAG: Response regulator of zinc sigma-54-dependent two-component system [Labilithrix sp.]|nr:Response regulator of zinc sigma-54-dependent two-component system [Labilithrix sp.]
MTTRLPGPKPGDPRDQAITEILVRQGERLTLRARTVRVEVLAGPSMGQVHELPGPEVRIGTGKNAHLVLFDPAVSRHHVSLRIETPGIRVVDAGSSNGTVLDGVRVLDAYAREGSLVVLGSTTLKVRLSSSVVDIPLSARESFGALLGRSVAMRQVFTLLERVSAAPDPILVEGETGTGKELVAEAIHEESPRASGPFVVFDCSAVTPSLVESELFGHVRGAFTGAVGERLGAFEAASGGTLFLDEIGELPLDMQPKLLRALERLEVKRVGDNQVRKVDVRVVAATNRNLAEEVTQRRFREDLYYRLAVIRLELPPLRARTDDVPLLIDHFVARSGKTLPPNTRAELATRAWPGNVRELRNAVARALSLGTLQEAVPSAGLATAPDLSVPLAIAKERHNDAFESAYLVEALRVSGGNATKAAELAGVNRKYMQRAIKRLGLRARLP